ncbi:MAG: host attachment protein [Pirellulales bacterium]
MTAWIFVGDTSRAQLFSTELREDPWTLIEGFEHPEGREFSREIRPTSPPGRAEQSSAYGARHTAMEPRTTPKEAEAQRFAQQVADYLEQAVAARKYDYLVLVAPPHFLGTLRGALGEQAAKHVRNTVNKDLTRLEPVEMRERLIDAVFPVAPTSS